MIMMEKPLPSDIHCYKVGLECAQYVPEDKGLCISSIYITTKVFAADIIEAIVHAETYFSRKYNTPMRTFCARIEDECECECECDEPCEKGWEEKWPTTQKGTSDSEVNEKT